MFNLMVSGKITAISEPHALPSGVVVVHVTITAKVFNGEVYGDWPMHIRCTDRLFDRMERFLTVGKYIGVSAYTMYYIDGHVPGELDLVLAANDLWIL